MKKLFEGFKKGPWPYDDCIIFRLVSYYKICLLFICSRGSASPSLNLEARANFNVSIGLVFSWDDWRDASRRASIVDMYWRSGWPLKKTFERTWPQLSNISRSQWKDKDLLIARELTCCFPNFKVCCNSATSWSKQLVWSEPKKIQILSSSAISSSTLLLFTSSMAPISEIGFEASNYSNSWSNNTVIPYGKSKKSSVLTFAALI